MLPTNQYALKEWAITVKYLGLGKQIFLLRKGGILEQRQGFEVRHPEFYLFPTYVHQSDSALHPDVLPDFRTSSQPAGSDKEVRLDYYAVTKKVLWISDLSRLRELEGSHTLNWSSVKQRFYYRRLGLHWVLLRVYRVDTPHRLANLSSYEGCISWVKLTEALTTYGARPVLSDEVFQGTSSAILEKLESKGGLHD